MEDKRILTQEQKDLLISIDIAFNPWIEDGMWIIIIPEDWTPEMCQNYPWIYDCPKKINSLKLSIKQEENTDNFNVDFQYF